MKTILLTLCLLTPALFAQEGNRRGHDNMSEVVPEELIPPAPVLSVEEALKSFTIADGFIIEPVAAEPLVEKPVALSFDADGRMWIVEMRGYMPNLDAKGEDTPEGHISILEDTDNDGQADKRTVFLDKILLPRSLALVKDGILFSDHNALYFCKRNGTQRTGEPVVVDPKYAPSGNVEHRPNGMMRHLNNWHYNAKSSKRYRWADGKLTKDSTQHRGQWGISMDNFGRLYHNSNSITLQGDKLLPDVLDSSIPAKFKPQTAIELGSLRVWPARVTPGVNRAYISIANGYDFNMLDPETHKLINTTASAGMSFYRGDNFPESFQDVTFSSESAVGLVKATRVTADGLSLSGKHVYPKSEFLTSTDERFRPVNIHTAPDGCLYLVDYYHGLIQHKTYITSYLRKQYESRDLDGPSFGHGRIYRIRYAKKPRGPQPQLSSSSTPELIAHLSHANGWWRDTAQRLLIERSDPESFTPLRTVLQSNQDDITRIHSLWTLAGLNQLTAEDLTPLLGRRTSSDLQCHALAAALELSAEVRSSLSSAAQDLISPGKATTPYAIRLIAGLPLTDSEPLLSSLKAAGDTPFIIDAALTGLFSQEVSEFPSSNDRLNYHLSNYNRYLKNKNSGTILTGELLASFERGKTLFLGSAACAGCHGADGLGLPNLGPPLDESEWVTGSTSRLTKILLHGLQGPIRVNGKNYKPLAAMPGLGMNPTVSDKDLADIMTYIRSEWSNKASQVTVPQVRKVREETKGRNGRLYTAKELGS